MSGNLQLPDDMAQQMAMQRAAEAGRAQFVLESAQRNLASRLIRIHDLDSPEKIEGENLTRLIQQVQREAKLAKIAGEALAIEFGLIRPRGSSECEPDASPVE